MFFKRKPTFSTDSIYIVYASPEIAVAWWHKVFNAETTEPGEMDDPLPGDIALRLDYELPCIFISHLDQVRASGLERSTDSHPVVTSTNLGKAHAHCKTVGAHPGPIQSSVGPRFFNLTDPEGNTIEICEET